MHYIYILELNNGQLYTGSTSDLRRRISEHKQGKCKFTSKRLPVALVYYEAYLEKADAQNREYYLKTSDGKRDLKRQMKSYFMKKGL